MATFPNAKINLGLNIVEKRPDGYHNLETIFYPVLIQDTLIVLPAGKDEKTRLHLSGNELGGNDADNLVLKAYHLLATNFDLPPVDIYLHKQIPSGAGLGGGSADGAFMLRTLNEDFNLRLSNEQLEEYAGRLGADCPFFIQNKPVFAKETGFSFEPVSLDLSNYYALIVKPNIFISTREAFSCIQPQQPAISLKDILKTPLEEWKKHMYNDFEKTIFRIHPQMLKIKEKLYEQGAIYASMSGSGSALYGIFSSPPSSETLTSEMELKDCFSWIGKLQAS